MAYPDPSTMDTSGLMGMLHYINAVTKGWISNGFIITVFIVSLIGYAKATQRLPEALAVSSFFTFVVALFFWLGGFVTGVTLGIVIAITIICALTFLLSK